MYYDRLKDQQRRQVQSCFVEPTDLSSRQYDIGVPRHRQSRRAEWDFYARQNNVQNRWPAFVAYPQPIPPSANQNRRHDVI